ncbi:nucleotidyltransferase domain-containing protein [Porphyromonas macacae]|uniref:nucleotidyltransferase domain-containing protein n=1 Tax=Porphyromonas macacae TaxID=28115 RepID=UPI0024AD8CAA|nr:nucleotidyltransferase family protein [Porphyromonas macacae]
MNIYPQFLELLSAAIWNRRANMTLFREMDERKWQDLIQLTKKQRVIGLISDAIQTLPKERQPPKAIRIKLLLLTEKIEEANLSLNKKLIKISEEYNRKEFKFALLKGQGNAVFYPNPLHRTSGDIDLYLYRKDDYERAKKWIRNRNFSHDLESIHHIGFVYESAHIENHRYVTYFTKKKYDRLLACAINRIIENDAFEWIRIENTPIRVLPVEFNAFYIYLHLFHHFISNGIGFRQVCDWLLILSEKDSRIDKKRFTELAEQFDLLKAMQTTAYACIKYLGTKPEIFPFELKQDTKYTDLLITDILEGGHFGYHRNGMEKKRSLWAGRWFRYTVAVKRAFKFGFIAPSHIFLVPLSKAITRLKLTLKRKE